jgi:hypothetical protein
MAFFGGNAGPVWPEFRSIFLDTNMTAISIAYVTAGFAIAADGRSKWDDESTADEITRGQESETEQKIFHWKHKKIEFAYAVTGMVFNKGKTFNLLSITDDALRTVADLQVNNLHDFIEQVCGHIKNSIMLAKVDGRIDKFQGNPLSDDPESERLIARMFFVGYRKGKPFLKLVTFSHENQIVDEPAIITQTPPAQNIFSGSIIAKLMFQDNDQRFKKYTRHISLSNSLQEAVECASGFIRACCDPIAPEIDRACCGIGGHLHVAEITSTAGFKWRIPPSAIEIPCRH